MKFFRTTARTPIGLDIGSRHVKAAQLECAHGPHAWRLAAAASFARDNPGGPPDEAELRAIADGLERRGFRGNRVVIPVPADKLIGGALEVPARAANVPVEQIARMELARTQRCAPESFEMGLWDLPTPARSKSTAQVMAVGCAHAEAETLLDTFESQGLDVMALDVRSCALARAVGAMLKGSDAAVSAILELGWDSAMLVMLHGGVIVYCRALADAGARALHESLHKELGLDSEVTGYLLSHVGMKLQSDGEQAGMVELPPQARKLLAGHADALVQELKASFSYVAQEYPDSPPARLLLAGGSAAIPGLCAYMAAALGIEVTLINPAELAECPPSLLPACSSPALAAAIGLSQFQEGV